MSDPAITINAAELGVLLSRAAEEGARNALASIGLHDVNAVSDVRELRDLLTAWRDAKRTVTFTALKWGITALLGLAALGLWTKLGGRQ